MGKRIFYSIVAPRRRAPFHYFGLGGLLLGRRWWRWQVVRETVSPPASDGITAFGYEAISAHWTWHAANRARANQASTPGIGPGQSSPPTGQAPGGAS